MDNNKSSVLQDTTDQLDKLGKSRSTTVLFICCIIGLVLVIWAFSLYFNPTKPSTLATITRLIICSNSVYMHNNRNRTTSCTYEVSYKIDNLDYSNVTLNTDSYRGNIGDVIEIEYNPNNHREIFEKKDNLSISFLLLLIAVVIVGFSYHNYVQTHNSKIYSAAQGAATITDTILGSRYVGPGYVGPGYHGYPRYGSNISINI